MPAEREGRYDTFVSYSHTDRAFVVRLQEALRSRGKHVWVDEEDIPPASRWADDLKQAIEASDSFVAVIGPDSVASPECGQELEHAASLNKRIVPLLLRRTDPGDMPESLSSLQFVPQRGLFEDDFERSLQLLVEAIETDLDWVREHTEWGQKAIEWHEHDRDRSFLLSGAELEAAEQWLARGSGKRPEPTELQRGYVLASRQESTRRLRRTRGFVSAALVVAIGLAIFALVEQRIAVSNQHAAQSRALTAEATAQLAVDPERAVLLALEALREKRTAGADLVLRRAVAADQLRGILPVSQGKVDVAFAPGDPDLLASADADDGTVRLWRASTGRTIATFRSATGAYGVAFSPRGDLLAAGFANGATRVWDVRTRRQALPDLVAGRSAIDSVSFSPNDDVVLVGSVDGHAYVWSARTGKLLAAATPPTAARGSGLTHAEYSPDGRGNALLGYGNGVVVLIRTGHPTVTLRGHNGGISAAKFSPDGSRIVTTSYDGLARLWTAALRPVANLGGVQEQIRFSSPNAQDAAFSPDGGLVAVAFGDGTVAVYDGRTGRIRNILRGNGSAAVAVRFSPRGDFVAAAYFDGAARVWDPRSGQQLALLAAGGGPMRREAFSSDGARLATAGADGHVRLWEPLPGRLVAESALDGYDRGSFTPDGRRFVAIGPDASLRDATSGRALRRLAVPARPSASPYFSADGRLMAIPSSAAIAVLDLRTGRRVRLDGSPFQPGTTASPYGAFAPGAGRMAAPAPGGQVTVWDVRTGHVVAALHRYGTPVSAVRFSRDGRRVASAGSAGVAYLEPAEGRGGAIALPSPASVFDAQFSPDGRLLATGAVGTQFQTQVEVQTWDARTGRSVGRPLHGAGFFVVFSRDGRSLVAGGVAGALVARVGHAGIIGDGTRIGSGEVLQSAAFSPGGAQLVVGELDAQRIYDVRTGQLLATLGAGQRTSRFQLSRDGRRVLNFGPRGLRLYACDVCGSTADVERAARALVHRGLTADERRRFVSAG